MVYFGGGRAIRLCVRARWSWNLVKIHCSRVAFGSMAGVNQYRHPITGREYDFYTAYAICSCCSNPSEKMISITFSDLSVPIYIYIYFILFRFRFSEGICFFFSFYPKMKLRLFVSYKFDSHTRILCRIK